ncbi:MAG: hypothetical protein HY848_01985 [Betaproteobacteria bacterium]|nr:hypothetical protein [Betaproteobacteria bacterium]
MMRELICTPIDRFRGLLFADVALSLSSRRAEKTETLNSRLIALQREAVDAVEKLKRLYRLI